MNTLGDIHDLTLKINERIKKMDSKIDENAKKLDSIDSKVNYNKDNCYTTKEKYDKKIEEIRNSVMDEYTLNIKISDLIDEKFKKIGEKYNLSYR